MTGPFTPCVPIFRTIVYAIPAPSPPHTPISAGIHALREEGDAYEPFHLREKIEISIHALREEGDQRQPCIVAKLLYFYPRPPRGGRLQPDFAYWLLVGFLSTPSARRATWVSCTSSFFSSISIHALREEDDMPI